MYICCSGGFLPFSVEKFGWNLKMGVLFSVLWECIMLTNRRTILDVALRFDGPTNIAYKAIYFFPCISIFNIDTYSICMSTHNVMPCAENNTIVYPCPSCASSLALQINRIQSFHLKWTNSVHVTRTVTSQPMQRRNEQVEKKEWNEMKKSKKKTTKTIWLCHDIHTCFTQHDARVRAHSSCIQNFSVYRQCDYMTDQCMAKEKLSKHNNRSNRVSKSRRTNSKQISNNVNQATQTRYNISFLIQFQRKQNYF